MPHTADSGFDAAVVDRENHAVALIQVKGHPLGDRWTTILSKQLARFGERAAFVLTIDLNSIALYRPEGETPVEPIVQLDTKQVLQHYDPEFPKKRVFESYLLTLAEAWLRDLAYHWKSDHPPGSEELRGAGLLEKVEGGTTQRLEA